MRATFLPLISQGGSILLFALTFSGCTNINDSIKNDDSGATHQISANKIQASTQSQKFKTPPRTNIPLNCRVNVLTPAKFRTARKRIKTFESAPAYLNVPATINWHSTRYQIAPARYTHETVPATYREVTEKITVLRRRVEIIGKPASYTTVNKPVTTQETHIGWKDGCAATDPMKCIVRIPAQQTVVQQQFVDFPARVMQVEKPEQTLELKRKVLVSPGKGYGPIIPAQYRDVKVGRVSKVWQLVAKPQPDRFANIPVRIKTRPERVRPVAAVCYEQAEQSHITLVQRSLQQRGYPITVNGTPDQQTLQAIVQFQHDHNLSIGAITLETLRKLDLY